MVAVLAVTRTAQLCRWIAMQPLVPDPFCDAPSSILRFRAVFLVGYLRKRIRMRILRVDTGCVEDYDREHS